MADRAVTGTQGGVVVAVNVAVVRAGFPTPAPSGLTGIDKRAVDGPVLLTASGVEGDTVCDTAHHGGAEQAVYAYSTGDLAFWSAELGDTVAPGGVGENLTLAGVDCSGAVVGERWRIGGAELMVRAPRIPCRVFAAFRDVPDLVVRFTRARRPGCYLSVERTGLVRAGDGVRVVHRPAHGVTVTEVMAAMTGARELVPHVERARDDLGPRVLGWLDTTVAAMRRVP